MNQETGHRATAGRPTAGTDRRVTGLVDQSQTTDVTGQGRKAFVTDPHRVIGLESGEHDNREHLRTGVIVYSVPYVNWYRVQLDATGETIGCCAASFSSFTPMGPRSTMTLPARCNVVLWRPPGQLHGIILGAFPLPQYDSRTVSPDYVSQGSQSGIQREDAYTSPFTRFYRNGGLLDFAANRPLDSTTLDWGMTTETGIGFHLDASMAFMRVNEICGLWMTYWDSYVKFAGWNMDWTTAASEIAVRDDEGELQLTESRFTYPWEGVGLYATGAAFTDNFSPVNVQYKLPRGAVDMAADEEDLQPIARFTERGGYLGQGRHVSVNIPAKDTGKRFYSDRDADMGVFEETIALDGSYMLRSASQVVVSKYCLIPVAKEIRPPEDQLSGDDARKNNYKFSGTFGGGDPHKVGDIAITEEQPHLKRAAGIFDVLAYSQNWKGLHPYAYHKNDYSLPQETDIRDMPRSEGGPQRAQDLLDFTELQDKTFMSPPDAVKVKVDDRYGDVDFFQRQSGLALLPDGGVVIYDGYGSTITLTGGHIRLDTPGDVILAPGRNIVGLAGDDAVIRARNSVDITAGNKDLRLKAENNLQILAHNGGVLVESQAKGFIAGYQNKIGEDVISSGVVIKAGQSSVVQWASDIYLRTGTTDPDAPGGLDSGNIVLDAGKGRSDVILRGSQVAITANQAATVTIGPVDETSNVQSVHVFGNQSVVLDGEVVVNSQFAALGDIISDGGVVSRDGFASVRAVPFVGTITDNELSDPIARIEKQLSDLRKQEQTEFNTFLQELYQPLQPGNDATIQAAAFSFRDDPDGAQYNTQDFALMESRWQQMSRLGLGTGGTPWTEPTVSYQGQDQLPYPGKVQWVDTPSLWQLKELTMYAADTGTSKDRPDPYLTPALSQWLKVKPQEGFTTV